MNKLTIILLIIIFPILLFGQGVEEYFISCDADSFRYIYDHPYEDHYIPIIFTYRDRSWTNVKMRIRGDSSRRFRKKSFKIKFGGERFSNGRDELNFNAEFLDKSYLHSILASDLMNASGQSCFEAAPARLFINGKFYGLYIRIENMDKDFLTAHRFDPDGNLYKAAKDGACLSIYDDLYHHWEKKTNENMNWNDLAELIVTINKVSDAEFYRFVSHCFDYEKMINIIAMNMLIANGSTYYHNYYLYHDIHNSNKWLMFPWDVDLSFNLYGVNYPYHRSSGYSAPDNPFLERSILCEPIFNDIKARVHELTNNLFNPVKLFPLIDSLQIKLTFSVEQDSLDDLPDTMTWNNVVLDLKNFITNRYADLQNQFSHSPTTFRIEKTIDIFTDSVTYVWHPAVDPDGDPVNYILKYSLKQNFSISETITYSQIADTIFTLPILPAEGEYFWMVTATDGQYSVDGFDTWNKFIVHSDVDDLVIFNEINYNSASDFNSEDWVELYNPHPLEIELTGWMFKDSDEMHEFTIPDYTRIKPDSYLIICRNQDKFNTLFPEVTSVVGDFSFGLSGDGEFIQLLDRQGTIIDSLTYDDNFPWPTAPDGNGPTLELISPLLDNALASNWAASTHHGTPGRQNDVFAKVNREFAQQMSFHLYQNYPNPFNEVTEINFNSPTSGNIELRIFNLQGQLIKVISHYSRCGGVDSIRWQATGFSSGIYFYQLKFRDQYSSLKKAILLK